MKKRSVIVGILLVVLLFVFVPSAHAGVGNTDSGGSSLIDSGGGSSWSDSGSSWSDGEVVGLVAAAGLVDPVATVLVQEQTLVVR